MNHNEFIEKIENSTLSGKDFNHPNHVRLAWLYLHRLKPLDALSSNCSDCVDNGKLGVNSVTTSKVADGTVTTAKLADQAVDSLKILNGAFVDADTSASANINGTKIRGSTIIDLNASIITSGTLSNARLPI